jgi:hypothetical protein
MEGWLGRLRMRIKRLEPVRGRVKRMLCVGEVDERMFGILELLAT